MPEAELTLEQLQTLDGLRAEIAALDAEEDGIWAEIKEAVANGGSTPKEVYQRLNAIWGERAFKEMLAHVPTKGERKTKSVKDKIKGFLGVAADPSLDNDPDWRSANAMRFRQEALEKVNVWRESMGLPLLDKLPRGHIGDGSECTLARAFKKGFNGHRDLTGVSIGGSGGGEIKWRERMDGSPLGEGFEPMDVDYDDENEWAYKSVDVETGDAGGSVVSNFDGGKFPDLVDQRDLVQRVLSSLESGELYENTQGAVFWEEWRRRALDPTDEDHASAKAGFGPVLAALKTALGTKESTTVDTSSLSSEVWALPLGRTYWVYPPRHLEIDDDGTLRHLSITYDD